MSEGTPTYQKIVSKHNGHLVMLYLTPYEIGLSTKRRLQDTEVYSQEELKRQLGLEQQKPNSTFINTFINILMIATLVGFLMFEIFKSV